MKMPTALALAGFAAIPFLLFGHPGVLDSDGGHTDERTGEYHYHRSQTTGPGTLVTSPFDLTPEEDPDPLDLIEELTATTEEQAAEIDLLNARFKELDARLRAIEQQGRTSGQSSD